MNLHDFIAAEYSAHSIDSERHDLAHRKFAEFRESIGGLYNFISMMADSIDGGLNEFPNIDCGLLSHEIPEYADCIESYGIRKISISAHGYDVNMLMAELMDRGWEMIGTAMVFETKYDSKRRPAIVMECIR